MPKNKIFCSLNFEVLYLSQFSIFGLIFLGKMFIRIEKFHFEKHEKQLLGNLACTIMTMREQLLQIKLNEAVIFLLIRSCPTQQMTLLSEKS